MNNHRMKWREIPGIIFRSKAPQSNCNLSLFLFSFQFTLGKLITGKLMLYWSLTVGWNQLEGEQRRQFYKIFFLNYVKAVIKGSTKSYSFDYILCDSECYSTCTIMHTYIYTNITQSHTYMRSYSSFTALLPFVISCFSQSHLQFLSGFSYLFLPSIHFYLFVHICIMIFFAQQFCQCVKKIKK